MVRIAVQVRSGAARFSVAVQAESIERALEIAKKQNLGRGCKGTFAVIDRGWGGRILPALDHLRDGKCGPLPGPVSDGPISGHVDAGA